MRIKPGALVSKEGRIRRAGSLEEVLLTGLAGWVCERGGCRRGANPGQRPQEGMSLWALGWEEVMETEEQAGSKV